MNEHSKPKIAVLGSINMDLVIRCATLPSPGETILADSSTEFCGGKGANQAVGAVKAGGDVSMIGAVGSDAFAPRLIEGLTRRGVYCGNIALVENQASGLAVISVDHNGENAIMVVPGANSVITHQLVQSTRELIAESDVLMIQLEIPLDVVRAGIELARECNTPVLLDPAPAPPVIPDWMFDVELICPNETEASALTGLPVTSIDDAADAAKRLSEMGARQVAITLGESGTMVHRSGRSVLIPSYSVAAVDTTAAGDAFAGALAVRLAQGHELDDAIRFANAAGALAASRPGAQASMADYLEIETLWNSKP